MRLYGERGQKQFHPRALRRPVSFEDRVKKEFFTGKNGRVSQWQTFRDGSFSSVEAGVVAGDTMSLGRIEKPLVVAPVRGTKTATAADLIGDMKRLQEANKETYASLMLVENNGEPKYPIYPISQVIKCLECFEPNTDVTMFIQSEPVPDLFFKGDDKFVSIAGIPDSAYIAGLPNHQNVPIFGSVIR